MPDDADKELVARLRGGAHEHHIAYPLLREAAARITELLAEREWRPIATAPRDGTLVLIRNHSSTALMLARFSSGVWRNNHYGPREPVWHFGAVTHWFPLPPPPAAKETGE